MACKFGEEKMEIELFWLILSLLFKIEVILTLQEKKKKKLKKNWPVAMIPG